MIWREGGAGSSGAEQIVGLRPVRRMRCGPPSMEWAAQCGAAGWGAGRWGEWITAAHLPNSLPDQVLRDDQPPHRPLGGCCPDRTHPHRVGPRAVTVGSTDRFVVCAASSDVEHLARTTCPGLLWRTAAAVLDGQRQPSSLAEQDALHRPRVSGRPDSRSRSMRSANCEESIAEFDADRYSGSRPAQSRPTPPVSGEHGRWVGSRGAECVGRTMPVIRRRRRSRER